MTLKLVVLDRDGVINQDSDAFIRSSVQWRAIDGSPEAIGLLSNNGFTVAVATNQSGLARGLFDEDALNEIHRVMAVTIAEAGGKIDRIVYCPHGPDDNCDCRKPAPGLLHQLGAYYALSMHGVPFIGDSLRDLEAAAAIGARGILVRSGKGAATEDALRAAGKSAETYDNLLQAAQYLIAEHR